MPELRLNSTATASLRGNSILENSGFSALRISIVSFKENANSASPIQPALQFFYVEIWFLMLAEGSTLGISFLFCLESLCRKTRPSCARVLWMAVNHMIRVVPNRHAGFFHRHACYFLPPCQMLDAAFWECREDVVLFALDCDSKDTFEHLDCWILRLFSESNAGNGYSMHNNHTSYSS